MQVIALQTLWLSVRDGGKLLQGAIDNGIIRRPSKRERIMLVQGLEHQSPGRAVGDRQARSLRALRAGLIVLVANDRLAELFQRGNANGNFCQRRAVEMNQKEITGARDAFRN